MRIRFRLREKLMLTTISIIIFAVAINVYANLRDFIRVYKESVTERIYAQSRELKVMIEDVIELGLDLGELKGLNEECKKMVEGCHRVYPGQRDIQIFCNVFHDIGIQEAVSLLDGMQRFDQGVGCMSMQPHGSINHSQPLVGKVS